ncbi:MAG: hypothetical protein ACPGQM_02000 [Alphaproteobacteria bacterium]
MILMIAAVAGASAIVGYAFGRFFGGRRLRYTEALRARLGATLATVPGGFVTWLDGGVEIDSEPDEGTAIVCRLPRRAVAAEPEDDEV